MKSEEGDMSEREQLLIMAAYFHGAPLDGPIRANCGRVLGQALVWAGLSIDDVKQQLLSAEGADDGDVSIVENWYETLILMTRRGPETLISKGGETWARQRVTEAAAPSFTACGLTSKGWEWAEKLLAERPHLVAQSKESLGGF